MNAEQEARVLDLIDELPWADVDAAIRDLELFLRLALDATTDAFLQWEAQAEEFGDECSLSPTEVDRFSPGWRLAYVARLLRSLALSYGVSAGFGNGPLVGEAQLATPAGIVRELNDIS